MRAFALLLLATITLAAGPSFQGNFKLNVSKSDFGPLPGPQSMAQEITHADPEMKSVTKMSSERGDFEFVFICTTDGKECSNNLGQSTMKSTMKWEGDALTVESKGYLGDNEVTMQDKWEMSADGATLTITRKWSSSQGEAVQKLILEKQ